jgi:hypothetical protein
MKLLITLAFVLFFSACAISPKLNTNVPPDDAGYVVVSIGSSGKSWATYHRLKFRDFGKTETAEVEYFPKSLYQDTIPDFDTPVGTGIVLTLRLKPGAYEFYNFETRRPLGIGGDLIFDARPNFSIPFIVSKGQVTYVGQFLAQDVNRPNLIGAPVTRFFYYIIDDKGERDIAIARRRMLIPANAVVNSFVAKAAQIGHPQITNTLMTPSELPSGHSH